MTWNAWYLNIAYSIDETQNHFNIMFKSLYRHRIYTVRNQQFLNKRSNLKTISVIILKSSRFDILTSYEKVPYFIVYKRFTTWNTQSIHQILGVTVKWETLKWTQNASPRIRRSIASKHSCKNITEIDVGSARKYRLFYCFEPLWGHPSFTGERHFQIYSFCWSLLGYPVGYAFKRGSKKPLYEGQ